MSVFKNLSWVVSVLIGTQMSVPGVFQTEARSVLFTPVPTPQCLLSSGRLGSEDQVASRRLEPEPTSLLSSVAHIPSAEAVAVGGAGVQLVPAPPWLHSQHSDPEGGRSAV